MDFGDWKLGMKYGEAWWYRASWVYWCSLGWAALRGWGWIRVMAFGKEVVDGERPFMAKVSCPKLKERLCWQPSLLPVFSWAQTLPYSEENPSSSSYGELPVLCSTSRGKYWWGILYVLLWMLFHNRPRADMGPVIVVRKIRGKVVKVWIQWDQTCSSGSGGFV